MTDALTIPSNALRENVLAVIHPCSDYFTNPFGTEQRWYKLKTCAKCDVGEIPFYRNTHIAYGFLGLRHTRNRFLFRNLIMWEPPLVK